MFQTHKTYITQDSRMLDLINENHSMLLLLQHFDMDFAVDNKTVKQVCSENGVNIHAFIVIGNLYNGFLPEQSDVMKIDDIKSVLLFLKNSHSFYTNSKYPELKYHLNKLTQNYKGNDFKLIENFFNDYFNEVLEHLGYEDEVAFPYFRRIIDEKATGGSGFSAKEYLNHHTDIETKLADLKNLFLRYISTKNDLNTKRQFLVTLFELEFDLKIHSIIEERVLIPLIEKIEKNRK